MSSSREEKLRSMAKRLVASRPDQVKSVRKNLKERFLAILDANTGAKEILNEAVCVPRLDLIIEDEKMEAEFEKLLSDLSDHLVEGQKKFLTKIMDLFEEHCSNKDYTAEFVTTTLLSASAILGIAWVLTDILPKTERYPIHAMLERAENDILDMAMVALQPYAGAVAKERGLPVKDTTMAEAGITASDH